MWGLLPFPLTADFFLTYRLSVDMLPEIRLNGDPPSNTDHANTRCRYDEGNNDESHKYESHEDHKEAFSLI